MRTLSLTAASWTAKLQLDKNHRRSQCNRRWETIQSRAVNNTWSRGPVVSLFVSMGNHITLTETRQYKWSKMFPVPNFIAYFTYTEQ